VLCPDGPAVAPVREAAWGLLTALEVEQPDRRLLRVTLAERWSAGLLARALCRSVASGVTETRLRVGEDAVLLGRLVPRQAPPDQAPSTGTGGAVLITGGLGALGLSTARILARRGYRAITLLARSAPGEAAQRVLDELAAGGTAVRVVRGDVTDAAACRAAVAEASADQPLRLVLHLAGATDDRAFDNLDPAAFAHVFAAKGQGARHLVDALSGQVLDALVLYSSASSVLGAAGQVNYAAANGHLAGLAQLWRAAGVPAVCVHWGPWLPADGGGLAAGAAVGRALSGLGVRPLTDAEAEQVLEVALEQRPERLVAVALDAGQYAARAAGHPRAAFVAEAGAPPVATSAPTPPEPPRGWLRDALTAGDPVDREERLHEELQAMVGDVLGERVAVDEDLGLTESGLDSIMLVDLRTRLSHALATDLPATLAIDYPTINKIVEHVVELVFPVAPAVVRARDDLDPGDLSFEELLRAVRADVSTDK
jgi:NAD(P)-dependent dehydrogenase (short-subunit alcohol dehydrogenase family)/acyl carrier protein